MSTKIKHLTFGKGKIGLESVLEDSKPVLNIGVLAKKHITGDTLKEDLNPQIRFYFETEDGLDVLIKMLNNCKDKFMKIPDELKMGA